MKTALLDMAREAETAAEFSIVVEELEAAINDARARRKALDADAEAAVFGDGNLAKLRKAKADVTDELENLDAALAGARRRHDAAVLAEKIQELDEYAVLLRGKKEAYIEAVTAYGEGMRQAREAYRQMDKLRASMEPLSDALMATGRRSEAVNTTVVLRDILGDRPRPHADLTRHGAKLDAVLCDILSGSIAPRPMVSTANGLAPSDRIGDMARAARPNAFFPGAGVAS